MFCQKSNSSLIPSLLRGACHSLKLNWFALPPQLSYDFEKIYDFADYLTFLIATKVTFACHFLHFKQKWKVLSTSFCINWWFLPEIVPTIMFTNFSNFIIPSTFVNWHLKACFKRKQVKKTRSAKKWVGDPTLCFLRHMNYEGKKFTFESIPGK